MPTKTKPFKLTMTAGQLGLITFDKSKAEAKALGEKLCSAIQSAFEEAKIETLPDRQLIRKVSEIYHSLHDFDDYGFGDTEGRYGMCDATVQYLKAHGHDALAEELSGDFLLFA